MHNTASECRAELHSDYFIVCCSHLGATTHPRERQDAHVSYASITSSNGDMNWKTLSARILLLVLIGPSLALHSQAQSSNLEAFARLYGYVSYFHPSDEAAETNWDAFVVHGVRSVEEAETYDELRLRLHDLFGPIAPTVDIYTTAEGPPPLPAALVPVDTAGLKPVAWQHRGLGIGTEVGAYQSQRLNRAAQRGRSFGVLMQSIPADTLRGMNIRLTARGRAEVADDEGQLQFWMRVDRPDREMGFFDNMGDRPITSSEWTEYEIAGTVADDAVAVAFGAFLMGSGTSWVDDVRLEVQHEGESWQQIHIPNSQFDLGEAGAAPEGWTHGRQGYAFRTAEEGTSGMSAVIESTESLPLFSAHPEPGETVTRSLGQGLSVRLPVALYSRDGQTLGATDFASLQTLRQTLDSVEAESLTVNDEAVRLASVIVAWNAIQHFFPYFADVSTDWEAVLASSLADARDDTDADDFLDTMNRMLSHLEDGHAYAAHPQMHEHGTLPVRVRFIEDRIVVVAADSTSPFQIGDVITVVDGTPALDVLQQRMQLQSGSEWWRRERVLRSFGLGPRDENVNVTLERDSTTVQVTSSRSNPGTVQEERPASVTEVEPGIFYLNLPQAEFSEIYERIDEISQADGVIVEMRGYPNGNHQIIQHMTDQPMESASWDIPQFIYPDREGMAFDTTSRWTLEPATPRIKGKVVFLTDERAISYAESVMGIVEAYELGEIIGHPTAGTNGNINRVQLPGGSSITFTGMRVQKHDNSPLYLVGVQPTMPLESTIAAIREGRDEHIEKAIEVIRLGR